MREEYGRRFQAVYIRIRSRNGYGNDIDVGKFNGDGNVYYYNDANDTDHDDNDDDHDNNDADERDNHTDDNGDD